MTTNTNLQEHLFDIEEQTQTGASETPYYIVYPDEFGGNWRVQAVPVTPDSFESRKALPEQYAQGPLDFTRHLYNDSLIHRLHRLRWRGIRDEKLSEVSGIPGGIFVHASGFIGGMH